MLVKPGIVVPYLLIERVLDILREDKAKDPDNKRLDAPINELEELVVGLKGGERWWKR